MGQESGFRSRGKSKRPIDFRVYLITDRKIFPDDEAMLRGIDEALKGGVKAVQLREKDLGTGRLLEMAYALRNLTHRYGASLFVNDRVDIAVAAGADGVHLGHAGVPVEAARKAGGGKMLIGRSTHSPEEALGAEEAGADFITFGPVFETESKRQYGRPLGTALLKKVAANSGVPVFGIGGIKAGNVQEILAAGAYGAALISGILGTDDIRSSAENFVRSLS